MFEPLRLYCSKDPDESAEIYSLVGNFAILRYDLQCTIILLPDSEGPDQTAWMRRLIWAFAVRIFPKTRFRMAWPTLCSELVIKAITLSLLSGMISCTASEIHSADYISFPLGSLGSLWYLWKWSSAHVYASVRKQCCQIHYCLWRVSIKPRLAFCFEREFFDVIYVIRSVFFVSKGNRFDV